MFRLINTRVFWYLMLAAAIFVAARAVGREYGDTSPVPVTEDFPAPGNRDVPQLATTIVQTVPVEPAPAATEATFAGVVRSATRAELGFLVAGRLTAREVEVGQVVEKGAPLARIDPSRYDNARSLAKARLTRVSVDIRQAKQDVRREQRLVATGAGRSEALEKLKSRLAAAEAARAQAVADLTEAERLMAETVLRAPFDGTIVETRLSAGELVRPGQTVMAMSAEDQLEVEVQVPESIRSRIVPDAAVSVHFPFDGSLRLTGRIQRLARAAAGRGDLFSVVVALPPSPHVSPGYTAEVAFEIEFETAVVVPVAAVADPGGEDPYVFRARDGTAERVPVQVVRLVGEHIAVRSSLEPGDEVVIGGHLKLVHGDTVEVVP